MHFESGNLNEHQTILVGKNHSVKDKPPGSAWLSKYMFKIEDNEK
jgi:hypothetical protein